jgi:CubicO group peptidase (beta-lactamase class C family)
MDSTSFVFSLENDSRRAQGHGSRANPAPTWNRRVGRKLYALGEKTGRPFEHWTTDEAVCALPSVDPDAQAMPAFAIPNAAGSLVTTGPDYARFLLAVLGEGSGRNLLSERARRETREANSRLPGPLAWGLGWGLDRSKESPSLWHWGDNGQFQNFVTVDLEKKRSLLVFTNGNGGRKVYERVVRALLGRDLPAFAWI